LTITRLGAGVAVPAKGPARLDRVLQHVEAAAIDREITNRAPWVPLITPRFVDLTSARVGNYQASGGGALLDQLWVR
jgi:hypothetical protein